MGLIGNVHGGQVLFCMLVFLLCCLSEAEQLWTHSTYQVTVTSLQGLVDSLADLTGGRLPGTETHLAIEGLVP